jgi:hypothetical protein
VAGYNCFPPHDYPPSSLCSGSLCQEWLARVSKPKACDSEHAHSLHHWWDVGSDIWKCAGRQVCKSGLVATEDTLFKVYDSLIKAGLNDRAAMGALHDMQNRGIYFRELAE